MIRALGPGAVALALAWAVAALPFPAVEAGARFDPWYSDVGGHWAEDYIRILWEEEVADGYPDGDGQVAWFLPDSHISRGEYAMLAAKVFDLTPYQTPEPTFHDVPPDALLYGEKPAYGWLEAAARDGIITGYPDGSFRPDADLQRGHAFAILVRALGLEAFALTLTPGQVNMHLAQFSDGHQVDSSVAHLIATAIKLRILRGYPDGTLRLESPLTRAEAAAIMRRSCLFRIGGPGKPFYPDGDGVDETVTLEIRTLKNRNASAWRIAITNSTGIELKILDGEAEPPSQVTWDGRDDSGRRMPPGTYFAQGWLDDTEGNRFEAVPVPLVLEERTLLGHLTPSQAAPGDLLQVAAQTTGRPLSVQVIAPMVWDLDPVQESSAYANLWSRTAPLPHLAPGATEVVLQADFGPVTRQVSLPFTVLGDLGLEAWLQPDRVPAGAQITVHALTWGQPERVLVRGCHVEGELDPVDDSEWQTWFRVPLEAKPGEYEVTVTAQWREEHLEAHLTYLVEDSLRKEVEFILSD